MDVFMQISSHPSLRWLNFQIDGPQNAKYCCAHVLLVWLQGVSSGQRHWLPSCEVLAEDGHRSVSLQTLLSMKGSCLTGGYIPPLEPVHIQKPINAPEQRLGPLASCGLIFKGHYSSTVLQTIDRGFCCKFIPGQLPFLPSPPFFTPDRWCY